MTDTPDDPPDYIQGPGPDYDPPPKTGETWTTPNSEGARP